MTQTIMSTEPKEYLKRAIRDHCFITHADEQLIDKNGHIQTSGWLFDFREVLMRPDITEAISHCFENTFSGDYQIGTIESAGIPLMSAIQTHAYHHTSHRLINGFFIRKSRKKDGRMRSVEGRIVKGVPIILVDDIVHSGTSFEKQIAILEREGYTITAIWSIIRFKPLSEYQHFVDRGIRVESLFSLDDFTDEIVKTTYRHTRIEQPNISLSSLWHHIGVHPSHHHVVAKSAPAVDVNHVYIGQDNGLFLALDRVTGQTRWSYKTSSTPDAKGVFSSPTLYNNTVYFGSYDGCLYALNTASGKLKWRYDVADWVGSSPAIATDLGIVFVGLEFGLIRKRGGIVALDARTGKELWIQRMQNYTHASPLYIQQHSLVVIGSNDGCIYAYDASTGTHIWKHESIPRSETMFESGFSDADIKGTCAYHADLDYIIALTMHGDVIILNRKNGSLVGQFTCEYGCYSSPVVYEHFLLVTSLDKYVYCFDLTTLTQKWRTYCGARIFSTPIINNDRWVIFGTNAGVTLFIDINSGMITLRYTLPERVTTRCAIFGNALYIPTNAGDVYAFTITYEEKE